jgi:hypothetical protein
MMSREEIVSRGDALAVALYQTPWQNHEQRLNAIRDALAGLDEVDGSNVTIAALYSLADLLAVAVTALVKLENGPETYRDDLAAMEAEKRRFVVNIDFEALTRNLDIDT